MVEFVAGAVFVGLVVLVALLASIRKAVFLLHDRLDELDDIEDSVIELNDRVDELEDDRRGF